MKQGKDSFSQFVLISVGLHLAVFIILTIRVVFFPGEVRPYEQAVRVDMVALPEKIKAQVPLAEKARPKPKPQPKPKPKPKPVVKKKPPKFKAVAKPKPKPVAKKKEQASAIERLKSLQKLRKAQEKETQKKEFKGNQLSKGDSLEGIQKLQHTSYLGDLNNHIRKFWNLPEWLANEDFKANIVLYIASDGKITSKKFLVKSGNNLFDQQVTDTIDKANPLPAPPENLVDFFASQGVEIRFPE